MSTLSPELQHKQWLSVSNIYTRSKKDFEPGIPIMAYKTPLPKDLQAQVPAETFQSQFPARGGPIPCQDYYTAGAEPAQWCQPWGGTCPLGRRVVPSRRADPVSDRNGFPLSKIVPQPSDNKTALYYLLIALVLIFALDKFY